MQARADPDACDEKEDVVHWGRARGGLDSEMYVLRRSPLYGAVQRAKGCGKGRGREVVHLLLRHGARPERVGAIHYRLKSLLGALGPPNIEDPVANLNSAAGVHAGCHREPWG